MSSFSMSVSQSVKYRTDPNTRLFSNSSLNLKQTPLLKLSPIGLCMEQMHISDLLPIGITDSTESDEYFFMIY